MRRPLLINPGIVGLLLLTGTAMADNPSTPASVTKTAPMQAMSDSSQTAAPQTGTLATPAATAPGPITKTAAFQATSAATETPAAQTSTMTAATVATPAAASATAPAQATASAAPAATIPATPAMTATGMPAGSSPSMPTRGMDMANVEHIFGAPLEKMAAVPADGTKLHPPITRWEYPDYVVYFEYNRVVHTVMKNHPFADTAQDGG